MKEETKLNTVTVNGNELVVNYTVTFGGNTVPVDIKTTINNNDMQGTMNMGQFRSFNLTGKRN